MNTTALTFVHPWLLALLWLVPLAAVGFAWRRARRRTRTDALVSRDMQKRQLLTDGGWLFGVQLSLFGLGLALALIALARPQYGEVQDKVTRRGRDLMIVLDVSRSMLAADAAPNRLERAKADLLDLVSSLGGDRAGLILFRHKAVPACPLTTDYAFLLQVLDAASPDSAPPGETDIGDAILKALDALDLQQSAHQAIVLVSDGEDLAGTVDDAVKKARDRGITIFTVGFGSTSGSPIPEADGGRVAYQGAEVSSKLNPTTLHAIASRTGGVYVPVGTARMNLGDLYRNHLSKLKTREQDETITRRQIERFAWFLLPALLLWLAAAALSAGRPLLRGSGPAAAALLAFLLVPVPARAESAPPDPLQLARQAQAQYRNGHYAEAAELYRKAAGAVSNKSNSRDFFNAGCAMFQAGRYQEAADLFRQAASAKPDPSIPWSYNLGCALLQAAQGVEATNSAAAKVKADRAAESAAAFQDALRSGGKDRQQQALNNLSLSGAKTEEARKQARDMGIMEKYGALEAPQLAQQLLDGQRRLGDSVAAALSNNAPSQIGQLEKAGAEARELADMIGPLAGKLEMALGQGGGTNAAAQIGALRQHAGALNDLMTRTADRLRDADASAREMVPMGEQASYILWKAIAPFDLLLREDLRAQSNLVGRIKGFAKKEPPPQAAANTMAVQGEAAVLTTLFSQRFAQAIPEGGQPAPAAPGGAEQGDTNAPAGITAETRAKIIKLASECAGMQNDAVKAGTEKDWGAAGTLAAESLAKLKEIEDLLPKQKQNQDQQNQQQQQQQDKQDQQNKQDQQDKQQPQQNPEPKPEPPKEDKQPQPARDKDEMTEEKAHELLQKARLREKEYQDEKQKRAFFDRAPGERDW